MTAFDILAAQGQRYRPSARRLPINLETLGEQKTVIDHLAEKAGQLEFTLQEARNTLRALQRERELAERIEEGIRKLRSQTTGAGIPALGAA